MPPVPKPLEHRSILAHRISACMAAVVAVTGCVMECWSGCPGRGRRLLCERESSISAWCGDRGTVVCRCEPEPQYPFQSRPSPGRHL